RRCRACQAVWERAFKFCPECGAPAGRREARLKLVVQCPDGAREEALLDGATVIVGSGSEATLQIRDPYVSKKHCQFTPGPSGEYRLEDLGSANGSFVKITGPTTLTLGSCFLVGGSLMSVEEA
ncbi:MAG: FHA domain-containing protein, partial [Planctomycetes bacterium]|nr:FHA domain-containing protein [Planctomycetota bacterium]